MKVALVYDRVNKFGGAERVLLALHEIFPEAPLYTLVYDPPKARWADVFTVKPTFLNALPFLRSKHELLSPLAPMAFETFNFDEYGLVISVTSSDAKAIVTKPKTLHLCYCLTPTRYFWSGAGDYGKDLKMRLLPSLIKKYLRTVDLLTSQRPDRYIAISKEVNRRIKKYYHRDSEVVYPPIDDKFFVKPLDKNKRKYYLVVSRLVPYKRIDLVVKAFNKLNSPLVIIGTGNQEIKLKNLAKENIKFLGQVSDTELRKAYREAKAVVFPQEEDFGLVPVEAQASGTPVLAFAKGGALETVVDGKTGLFFEKQTIESIISAVNKFEEKDFDYTRCVDNAKKFTIDKFKTELRGKVDSAFGSFSDQAA